MNECDLTFTESRMHRKMPVRFGERSTETEIRKDYGAVIRLHRDNPKAANQVIMGLLFVIAASSITSIISFS